MPMGYQDPFLEQQNMLAGMQPGGMGSSMINVDMPSLQDEGTGARQFIDTGMPQSGLLDMAIAKKQAEGQSSSSGDIGSDQGYDPTGKTQEQIMAETGRQSELDAMGSQPQPVQQFAQPQQPQTRQNLITDALKDEATILKESGQQSTLDKAGASGVDVSKPIDIQPSPVVEAQSKYEKSTPVPGDVTITAKANQAYRNGQINRGTDFAGPSGKPVYMPEGEWQVVSSRNDVTDRRIDDYSPAQNSGWGNSVEVINSKTGEKMRMSHMQYGSVPDLKPGQVLQGGTQVGAIGNTGNTVGKTGNHLDVEYYDTNGNRQDVSKTNYADGLFTQPSPQNQIEGVQQYDQPTGPKQEGVSVDMPSLQNEQGMMNKIGSFVNDVIGGNEQASLDLPTQQPSPQQQIKAPVNEQFYTSMPDNQREAAQKSAPAIVESLKEQGITDPKAVSYALATASGESSFVPKDEKMAQRGINAHNDKIANYQDNYDGGKEFHGRGYIQLTHKSNYKKYGDKIGVDLVSNPNLANDPEIAGKILAVYMKESGAADAASKGDYHRARVLVNGRDALNSEEIARQAQQWEQYF